MGQWSIRWQCLPWHTLPPTYQAKAISINYVLLRSRNHMWQLHLATSHFSPAQVSKSYYAVMYSQLAWVCGMFAATLVLQSTRLHKGRQLSSVL